jgi:hypothetical protein
MAGIVSCVGAWTAPVHIDCDRRSLLRFVASTWTTSRILIGSVNPAEAVASVTPSQFDTILRDSSRSISRVEFSGPLNTVVTVQLIDGTSFTIRDVVESSTDPRSPLKIAATCREFGIPTSYPDINALLSKTPRKKKIYTNERVLEAQRKTKEQLDRIQQDEEDRLATLYKIEQESGSQ